MSKLSIEQKTIRELLTDKRSNFLIPDYQRPYAWTEDECDTLWDDLFAFCFPDFDYTKFDRDSEYFLGPIVTYQNKQNKLEIIDGQQRLTTILLLLRAFYDKFELMRDEQSKSLRHNISMCVWKFDEFDRPDLQQLKIDSEVASDEDKQTFLDILRTGKAEGSKSNYAKNFCYFQQRLEDLLHHYPTFIVYFATRILNNVILLPIEAESQDTALRIFSTLNDRGLPLSDADIFKSKLYGFYSDHGHKEDFINRWKALENLTKEVFPNARSGPMVELFTQYMYYKRAKNGIVGTSTPALRVFFEGGNNYQLLRSDEIMPDLEALAHFWKRLMLHDGLSEKLQKQLFVLKYAPNSMWTYLTSVYFFACRDASNQIEDSKMEQFFDKITAFIFAYTLLRTTVSALRAPIYPEMNALVKTKEITFAKNKFNRTKLENAFANFTFSNSRPITRSLLTWWAMRNPLQQVLDPENPFDIEHIYAARRKEVNPLKIKSNFESLGNKSILERRINIRASDYRFEDKIKIYLGTSGEYKTKIAELRALASQPKPHFTEEDIEQRTRTIVSGFMDYLAENQLLSDD